MKTLFNKALIQKIALISIALLPTALFAKGLSYNGTVDVWTSGARQYMQGTLDVRFNSTIAGSPYIGANGYAGGTVYFFGRDSAGDYFSCYVLTNDTNYADFAALKNSVKNGSRIYAYKSTSSNTCIDVSVGTYSYYIN
ncbi:hypothetical protein [Teredinibacter franksiae]|jgi:hypothetical protein|uniref:hypothetical protein n=1 Tax=Teredinibacter franksiae TaxID=2761453 RepID=UPI00162808FA|nr:hypothetical protein [Teredinibacter franksiae]